MPSRRSFLQGAAASSALGALTGCDAFWSRVSRHLGADLPERLEPPRSEEIDEAHHLLNRAAYGPWPGDIERVRRMGAGAWVDEQLEPATLSDAACEVRTGLIDTVHLPPSLVFELSPRAVERQLVAYTLLKAVYSRRQLNEVMVGFWTDHFNIAIGKSLCRHLKTGDDREVIRKHALGSFRTLLEASAKSAAMLVYLDGRDNKRRSDREIPNENYARELLELHTLGVHGGYTQADVMEAARCLTGWVVREKWAPGEVRFVPERHDDGEKRVLGKTIPAGGGAEDVGRLLDVLLAHPSCARFIATKLCRTFIEDDPPRRVVESVASTFTATKGDIKKTLRAVLTSESFRAARGRKLKRPFRFVVSALRALAADTHAKKGLHRYLARMGQLPFQHPTPDGYSMEPQPWLGTLLWRWNFALDLADGRLGDTRVDLKALTRSLGAQASDPVEPTMRHLLGRAPKASELDVVRSYLASPTGRAEPHRALALVLASPAFQRH